MDPYYQNISRKAQRKEDQPCYEDELELNESINGTIDLECMIEDKPTAKN